MIEEGKRVCQTCGTSLPVSSASCPVCALRTALDSGEGESTTVLRLSASQYRFEHYEIVIREDQKPLELGRGGMGVTYKATDTNLHCPVALKVIHIIAGTWMMSPCDSVSWPRQEPLPVYGTRMLLQYSILGESTATISTRWSSWMESRSTACSNCADP